MTGASEQGSTRQCRSYALVALALLAALFGLGNKIVRCTAHDGTAHVEIAHPAGTCSHSDPDAGSAPPRACTLDDQLPHQEALLEHPECHDVSILGSGVPSPRRSAAPIPAPGAFARVADEPAPLGCAERALRQRNTGLPRPSSSAQLQRSTVLLI